MAQRRPSPRLTALSLATLTAFLAAFVFLRPGQECRAKEKETTNSAEKSTPPISVSVLVVAAESIETPVPATGTLLPRESVEIVSELSRRLVRIFADEGQVVKKGDVLFELDASDLVAEQKRLEVQQQLADRNAARQDELLREAVTTEAEADAARTAARELAASRHMVAVTLGKTKIQAPFAGVLGLRQVSKGAWVTPSTPLITLADVSQLKIDFRIPERHAASIQVGGKFRVFVEGHPQSFAGRITATEPSIDPSSRSLLVRGVVDAEQKLIPGTFAKVELPLVQEDAIVIPPIAVIPGIDGRAVYVERNGVARLVPVELGVRTPEKVQVKKGLTQGERVIVTNLLRLRDGAPVRLETRSDDPQAGR